MPEFQMVQSGDVTLSVAEEGDRQRPTVVFIHGYPDTKAMWDQVRSHLSADFHTVAYDVRGAGASSAPRGAAAYDLELLGDDLLAVLDATASGRRAHLIGHDWGGLQGWEFATLPRFAERLASFTAVAAPSIDQVALAGLELRRRPWAALARAWRSWYILVLLTPGGPELTWRLLISEQRWRQELRRQGVPSQADIPRPTLASDGIFGANLYRRNMPRRVLSPRRDAFAHVPVQLIIPTRDRYIPVEYYDLAESYAPRLQRHELDATHWVPLTHSDVVADLIRGFVTGIEAES